MSLPSGVKTDRRLRQIDGLRALGMWMVYLFHTWEFGKNPTLVVNVSGHEINLIGFLKNFGSGVDLFMVISGFCLFWPLCQSEEAMRDWNWREYFRRRIRRIVPPYYAAIGYTIGLPILLVAIFHALHWQANWQPIPNTWQLFTHFLFIHSLFPSSWNGITGAFWSLGLEMQFYVLFPLVVFRFRRSGTAIIWAMVAVSVIFRICVPFFVHDPDWVQVCSMSFPGRWMEFALGMYTALNVSARRRAGDMASASTGNAQIAGALLLYIAAVYPYTGALKIFPFYYLFLSFAFSLFVFALCTSETPVSKIFTNRVAVSLGTISYSLYLIHQPTAWYFSQFIKKLMHIGGLGEFGLLATVGFCGVLAIGYPFFLIFERPTLTPPRSASRPKTAAPLRKDDPAPAESSDAHSFSPAR
jgi:peptidoglycan/LPS O-acetylase OafA/YrhL